MSLLALFRREFALGWHTSTDSLAQAGFFILIAALFPLSLGPGPDLLQQLGISIIWIAAVLSSLPGFDRLFDADYRIGWCEQVALSGAGLSQYVMAKAVSWYCLTVLPLLFMTPVMMLILNLPLSCLGDVLASLALGMMALLLLGTISAAITLGALKTALLVSLIILPLSVPILIFGVLAGDAACMNDTALQTPAHVYLLLLGAFTAVLLVLTPLAGQAGLSAALEER